MAAKFLHLSLWFIGFTFTQELRASFPCSKDDLAIAMGLWPQKQMATSSLETPTEAVEKYGYIVRAEALKCLQKNPEFWARSGITIEDLYQEGLVHLVLQWHHYDPQRANKKTFVGMITRNRLSALRKRFSTESRTGSVIEDFNFEIFVGPKKESTFQDEIEWLNHQLTMLPANKSDLVKMYFYQDLTFEEIADQFGKTKAWAHITVKRTLEHLKELAEKNSTK